VRAGAAGIVSSTSGRPGVTVACGRLEDAPEDPDSIWTGR
jgi:hypothetical protein